MKLALKNIVLSLAALLVTAAPLSVVNQAVAATGPNLIANASAENSSNSQPVDWNHGGWGNNVSAFNYVDGGHTGAKSLGLTVNSYIDGDAKWYATPVNVAPNTSYTFSDYYTATINTDVIAQFTDINGNNTYQELKNVTAASMWQQMSASFTTPANVKTVTIFHLIAGNGTLTIDDAYLGTTDTAPVTPPATDGNLIANGSLETANGSTPQGWMTDKWGTNTVAFSYDTTGHSGRSVSVNMSARTSGDAKWYATPVAVSANTKYTYTDYYKASVATEVVTQFEDTSGNFTYQSVVAPAQATAWTQATGSFTTPANVKKVAIFHIINKVGTLSIDDASLTAGETTTPPVTPPVTPPTSPGNMVPNNSFETADGANPAGWQSAGWGMNDRKFAYLNTGHTGNRSVQVSMTTRTNGDAEWTFPTQAITAGKQYTFSDYYKSGVATEVDARVTMKDGTTQFMYIGSAAASPDWLKFERTFTAPANATSITIIHLLYQAGSLTTDDYSLSEYTVVGFNRALVSLTFDDAWRSVYTNALPTMKKYGFTSTQYLLTGNLGDPDYMTKTQMQAFAAAGHEIASHTVTHPDLTTVSASQLTTELAQSKNNLQTWTGATVKNFATPYGAYNSTVLSAIKKYYSSHRGVETGYNSKNDFDVYDIKVQNIVNTTTVADVAAWVAQAQYDKTWLVLVYHQISTDPAAGEYNTPPVTFDAQMKAVKDSRVVVKTVQQSLTELLPQL